MRTQTQARRLRRFLVSKEIVVFILVTVSFVLLAFEHFGKLSTFWLKVTEVYEIIVGILFLAEFWFELHFARDRRKYWKHHWFYLLASIPVPMQTFEFLRGIRLLRLLRLFKVFAHFGYENNTRLFERNQR